jgi:lipopolysaccharide transport system ATP-binding protein
MATDLSDSNALAVDAPLAIIKVKNLCKRYPLYRSPGQRLAHALFGRIAGKPQEYMALDDVSFEVAAGDALAVIGRNGAGKSTLLQILAGVLEPTSGKVIVPGNIVGLLELGSGFNPEFTGRENVRINGAIFGLQRNQVEDRLGAIVDFADIGKFIDQPVKTYSSGMFLRLAFSVAVNVDPKLLLVDEALTVGDVFFQQKCYSRLAEMRSNGMSVVLVTHSMADAAEFCNRGLVLSQGKTAFVGNGKEAVEYYFHHERSTPTGRGSSSTGSVAISAVDSTVSVGQTLPATLQHPETLDLLNVAQFGVDTVRAVRMMIADNQDEPRRVFAQGDWIRVYVDYRVDERISVPISGVQLLNARGVLVHGRNSLQFDEPVPAIIPPGTIVRCCQDIKLDVDVGEYTLEVGIAEIPEALYANRHRYSPAEVAPQIRLLCHVSSVASISVVYRSEGYPCLFSHYGAADLPGHQHMTTMASTP